MRAHECHHCKQWVEDGEFHDCWTTTEAALTEDLPDDLKEAWERLRETAAELGEQRIYASGKAIMFARRVCYAFVRPRRSLLELVIILGRSVRGPQVRRVEKKSRSKVAHIIPIRHRDEVEGPIAEWLREAYEFCEAPPPAKRTAPHRRTRRSTRSTTRRRGPS